MTVLVTGSGVVPIAFAQSALKRQERILFFDPAPQNDFLSRLFGQGNFEYVRGDLRDLPLLIETLRHYRVETVVHAGGMAGGASASLYAGFDVNLGGTAALAEAVRLVGVRRLVHISTAGVYDWRRAADGPVDEDFRRGGGRGNGNYRIAREVILESYQLRYRFELITLRPATVFGLSDPQSQAGGGKFQKALVAALAGLPADISESDVIDNEYIYAKDLGAAIDLAVTTTVQGALTLNVGTGTLVPFSDVIAAMRKAVPGMGTRIIKGVPASKRQPMDISRLGSVLGWRAQFSLEDAFADYIAELRSAVIPPQTSQHSFASRAS